MRTIELDVKKDGKLIREQRYIGPSQWSDLTSEHLILWAAAMSSRTELLKAKTVLAAFLFNIPRQILVSVLNKKERFRLAQVTNFLFERNKLNEWLLPTISYRFRKYYGPKSKLSNITVEEFTLCELCYERFDQTGDITWLNVLAATLFRPRRWFGITDDIRLPYTTNGIESRAMLFAKLPQKFLWAIYLNYEGCRNFIIDSNRYVFKKGAPGAGGKKNITPWSAIVRSGAGGIFGTLSETEKSNIHKFLSELDARMKEEKNKPTS